MRSRCLDAVRDLIEHGLQPDDITLGALMEACVADARGSTVPREFFFVVTVNRTRATWSTYGIVYDSLYPRSPKTIF